MRSRVTQCSPAAQAAVNDAARQHEWASGRCIIPMESPYCSCKLARVRSQEIQEKRNQALTTSSDVPAGSSLAWFPRSDFNGGCGSLKELYGR